MEEAIVYFFVMVLIGINLTVFYVCLKCMIDIDEIRIHVRGARRELERFDKSKVKYTDGDNT